MGVAAQEDAIPRVDELMDSRPIAYLHHRTATRKKICQSRKRWSGANLFALFPPDIQSRRLIFGDCASQKLTTEPPGPGPIAWWAATVLLCARSKCPVGPFQDVRPSQSSLLFNLGRSLCPPQAGRTLLGPSGSPPRQIRPGLHLTAHLTSPPSFSWPTTDRLGSGSTRSRNRRP